MPFCEVLFSLEPRRLLLLPETGEIQCMISIIVIWALVIYSCSLSPVVSKASSGAMEVMTVFSLSDMPGFLSVRAPMLSAHILFLNMTGVCLHDLPGCSESWWMGGGRYV